MRLATYKVFTPYWRAWRDEPHRTPEPAPGRIEVPDDLETGELPAIGALTDGAPASRLPEGGETAGRALLDTWLDDEVASYDDAQDDLGGDATSRLSPYLHFGCLSPGEMLARADLRRNGVKPFVRQLCWRDFHHQVLAARPDAAHEDYRTQHDDWNDDADALDAWKHGGTGYPIVDAGMRQLLEEGWMHNRARLITASFLCKHLYVDWRHGAAHFLDHLVDGDVANNQMNWQWMAGTGTDTRPNAC